MRNENSSGSKVTLHTVSSLDGFIARKDNSVSWLEHHGSIYEAGRSISAEEAADFVKTIDWYVLGSRTYEHALELGWPWRYPDCRADEQDVAGYKAKRRILLGRSQDTC